MQIAVATAHLAGGAAPIEQSRDCRQPFAPFLEQFVYVLRHETGLPPCREAVMLRLRYVGHLGRAAAVQMPLGSRMEKRDVVGELIDQLRTEATTLGQCIEQQSLIERRITTTQSAASPEEEKAMAPAAVRTMQRTSR